MVVEALRRGVVRYVVDWRIEGRVRDRGVVIEARRGIVARRRWLGAIVGGGAGGCSSNCSWMGLEETRDGRRSSTRMVCGNGDRPNGCEFEVFGVEDFENFSGKHVCTVCILV